MEIKLASQDKYRMDLLVFCNQLNMIGVRYLSSFLQLKGIAVRIVYMISPADSFENIFSDSLYERVCEFCRGAGLVGLSVTTSFFPEARRLTGFLKDRLKSPIVWGGVHPTIEVEESLRYADYVVVGEGEMPTYELVTSLADKKDVTRIKNLAFKNNGSVVKNPLRALNDLDDLPMPDLDFTAHYLVDGDEIRPITAELMKKYMITFSNRPRVTYNISTTRGCPHSCTYCANYALREIFGHAGYVRKRPVEGIIEELKEILKKYPFIEYIFIADETFFIQKTEVIKKFAQLYKEEIGLPLKIEFSPQTFDEEKLKYMLAAGAVELHMGVESGSDDTNYNIYHRKFPINRIKAILNSLDKHSGLLEVIHLHILICNPFEKLRNTKETFRFVADLSNSFRIRFFPLVLFPGTKLFKMAEASGKIKDREKDVYLKTWNMEEAIKKADYYTISAVLLHKIKRGCKISNSSSLAFYNLMTFPLIRWLLGNRLGRIAMVNAYLFLQWLKRMPKTGK